MVLPIALELSGRNVVVFGGGRVATRKVGRLLDASANVRVVAPEVSEDIRSLRQSGEVEVELRAFRREDVRGQLLVFAATDAPDVNSDIVEAARAQGVLSNSATGGGDFTLGATIQQGSVQISVWSGGSPALAVRLRDQIAASLDDRWGAVGDVFGALRESIVGSSTESTRREFWERLADGIPDMWGSRAQSVRWIRSVADAVGLELSDEAIDRAVDPGDS